MKDRTCSRRHSSAYRLEGGRIVCPFCREDRGPAPTSTEPTPAESPPTVEASIPVESSAVGAQEQTPVSTAPTASSSASDFTIPDSAVSPLPKQKGGRKAVGSVRSRNAADAASGKRD